VLKAYSWAVSLGARGLREVAEVAVLNNNYLLNRMKEIAGLAIPYGVEKRRIEQVRYSWEELAQETGVHTEEVGARAADYGLHYWTSHHPWVIAEPCTLEPTESPSRADLDEYAATLEHVAEEARSNPQLVKQAPHRSTIHRIDHSPLDDPSCWAMTWRAYRRKLASSRSDVTAEGRDLGQR
jgi:glycine dehydrogenase subunit 2